MSDYIECFACHVKSPDIEGKTHPYMLSSPGCWAMYCEVLEREYSDVRHRKAHHYTVDACAARPIGSKDDKRAKNSVNLHLASLHAIFENGLRPAEAATFKQKPSRSA